ncbi:MAG: NUDIX domain-containing protein [Rhodospirillales bacterium]
MTDDPAGVSATEAPAASPGPTDPLAGADRPGLAVTADTPHTSTMRSQHLPGPSVEAIPEGDNRTRLVCPDCGYIEYTNPKIVVGAVCTWQNRILLCKRAINPSRGRWTIPAGFLEIGETTAEGAAREVWEEAGARIRIQDLLGIYEIPSISQIQMIYRAPMTGPECAPGAESLEVEMLEWDAIPWNELAFPSVAWALERFQAGGGPWFQTAKQR